MRTIYLQRSLSMNGRSALGGRRLADRLREVSEEFLLGHLINTEGYTAKVAPELRGDVISEVQMLQLAPDVIFVEGGLFTGSGGMWRFDRQLATEFVNNGGVLIIADVDVNTLREQRSEYEQAATFLGAGASYRYNEPVVGYDERNYWNGTKQIVCKPDDMTLSDWLKPTYAGVSEVVCGLPVRLASWRNLLISGNRNSTCSDATDGIPGPDNLPFGSVHKSGEGFVVLICADVSGDVWLERCPDNTRWLVNVAQFLSEAARKDTVRGSSVLKSGESIFLSHAHEDKPLVARVHRLLAREHSMPAWLDQDRMIPGDALSEYIEQAVRTASLFVLFWSRAASESVWVRRELELASDLKKNGSLMIVRLDETAVPDQIANLLRIEAPDSDEAEISRQLSKAIERRRTRNRIEQARQRATSG